ncbi:MAG TPA: enoyl-CoA hydratase-related protein [Pirellulaceae bacterium]|nr:enoyl-CoA hydratase-related protein [Pirellulaceae bacterium]HMO93882.1 enoyl-CoA hydratase-related protein [Pirellulaceae bacterium]HMP70897.1 enoyl-CoA hydratase-related protein [Pirellulaceae bacterium]
MVVEINSTSAIQRSEVAPGIALLTFDMPGKSANVLTQEMFAELAQQLDQLEKEQASLRGCILISAKPKIFFAGADLNLIWNSLDWPDDDIRDFCRRGQRIFSRLGSFPFPTVAAIHGICVGGGLELTLACDFRVCSDARNTLLGLPEVKLGLIPGWCGTVRTPRLVGLTEGIELVVSGRLINADEADALLLIDEIVPESDLIAAAVNLIEKCDQKKLHARRRLVNEPIISSQIKQNRLDDWETRIHANRAIHEFALLTVVEHMIRSAELPLHQAGESEGIAMSKVWGSESSRGLLNMFFVDEWIKKHVHRALDDYPNQDSPEQPKAIETIGIVGVGQMGTQVAQALAAKQFHLWLYDANPEVAAKLASRLALPNGKVNIATSINDLATCDFIFESIVENRQVKIDVLSRIEKVVRPDTVFASNTSAIPIQEIRRGLQRPQNVIGLHVFHPYTERRLCEIILSKRNASADTPLPNSASTVRTAIEIAKSLGKTAILVEDSPGFLVNRILAPMLDQAMNLISAGVAIEAVERAAHDFGFELGPCQMIDEIGVDTIFYVGVVFAERIPALLGRSRILPQLIKANRLGAKTSAGFYDYENGKRGDQPSAQLEQLLERAIDGKTTLQLSSEQIQLNLLIPMIVEGIIALEEGIVRDVREIDFAAVHGAGFPAYRGGPVFCGDRMGLRTLVQHVHEIAALRPGLQVPRSLQRMVESDRRFYD